MERSLAQNKSPWLRQEPEKEKDASSMYHGGSFKQYMVFKNAKLQEQFEAQQLQQHAESELFKGVSIHVNGLTVPSHQELKQIMALHGGRFETYYHRNRVTHIICNNLPDTKLKQLAHARDPVPIVKPEWIVACLRAGQILPLKDFLLEPMRDIPGQRQLFEFKAHQPAALAATELYPALQQQHQQQQQPSLQEQTLLDASRQQDVLQQASESLHETPPQQQQPLHYQQQQQGRMPPPPDRRPKQQHQQQPPPPTHQLHPQSDKQLPQQQNHPQQQQPQHQGAPDCSLEKAQATAAALRDSCDLLKGPPRSSADDPEGFVGSFFRSSRLHFIGTWKARIEALMAEHQQQQQASAIAECTMGMFGRQQQQQQRAGGSSGRTIVHLDMDCFFAAVAAVGRPEFAGKPLAVCHSASAQGSAEVSSANYEARAFGIRAGMFMAEAKSRCPQLLVVPYEFDRYEEISEQVYRILLRHTPVVMPLSCDEAFLDLTGVTADPQALVAQIRSEIQATTQCTASAGVGPNMLLARIATKRAKPNGQAVIKSDQAREFLGDLAVDELPGVGWSMKGKLADMGITLVRQIWSSSKELLMLKLGTQTGTSLWQHAHGIDNRAVEPPKARRSVGAEVNWGVRFGNEADALKFLRELSAEVASRLSAAKAKAKCLTLKIKRRQAGAPEPAKFLGHGYCDSLSRSVTLGKYVSGAGEVYDQAALLLVAMKIPPEEIRGLGITASKLDTDSSSHTARPSGPAPAKVAPSKQGVFDASKQPPWMLAFQKFLGKREQEQPGKDTDQQQQQWRAGNSSLKDDQQQDVIGLSSMDVENNGRDKGEAASSSALTPQKRPHSSTTAAAAALGAAAALAGDCSPAAAATYFAAAMADDGGDAGNVFDLATAAAAAGSTPKRQRVVQDPAAAAAAAAASVIGSTTSSRSPSVVGQQRTLHDMLSAQQQPQHEQQASIAEKLQQPALVQEIHHVQPEHEQQGPLEGLEQQEQQQHQQISRCTDSDCKAETTAGRPAEAAAAVAASEPVSPPPPAAATRDLDGLIDHEGLEHDDDHHDLDGSPTSEDLLMMASLPDGSPPDSAAAAVLPAAATDAVEEMNDRVFASPSAKRKLFSSGKPAAAVRGAGGVGSSSTPIAALPPLSQIDPEVLEALPSDLKREIAAAYGTGAMHLNAPAAAAAVSRSNASPGTAAAAAARRPAATAAGGNWLRAGAAAAGKQRSRPKSIRDSMNMHNGAFVPEKRHKAAAGHNGSRSSHHPLPEVLTHMHQIDPEVLAELPLELQQELQANLLGKPKKAPKPAAAPATTAAGRFGSGLRPACILAAADGAGNINSGSNSYEQNRQQIGLGRSWGFSAAAGSDKASSTSGQQQQLFVDEPVCDILWDLTITLDSLLPACSHPSAAAAAVGSEDNHSSTGAAATCDQKLSILAEYLVHWLLDHDADLDAVRRVLKLLKERCRSLQQLENARKLQNFETIMVVQDCDKIAAAECMRVHLQRVVDCVQEQVQNRFGFHLKL